MRMLRRLFRHLRSVQRDSSERVYHVEAVRSPTPRLYETLYETVARGAADDADVVGGGSFDHVGLLELRVLLMEGLKPTDTLLDFGCGTGRLALQAIPMLAGGRYIGVDISETMLDRARKRVAQRLPDHSCEVLWVKQSSPEFPFPDQSISFMCAFSTFTHMEHEDSYCYLKSALRVVEPQGKFVFSCLPMNLKYSQDVFLTSAEEDLETRWSKVRNVTTSVDLMTTIAQLAGWTVLRWYAGDQENIRRADTGQLYPFVQSLCVLERPGS